MAVLSAASAVRAWLWLRPRTPATVSPGISAGRGPILRQALLSPRAVRPGIAARTVIAECAVAVAAIRLLAVTTSGFSLSLIQVVGPTLILIDTCAVLLIRGWPVLLIHAPHGFAD